MIFVSMEKVNSQTKEARQGYVKIKETSIEVLIFYKIIIYIILVATKKMVIRRNTNLGFVE